MAFIKQNNNQQNLNSFEKISEKQFEKTTPPKIVTQSVPFVFLKKIEEGKQIYRGFVPGIVMKDVISENLETCKTELESKIKEKLKAKVQLASPMPYFPTNEEILKGYDNVCLIKRMKFSYREYQTRL